jgi:hypothetical protein
MTALLLFRNHISGRLTKVACLILLLSSPAFAQASDPRVFAPVPEARRARLIERLNLLIEYQKTQQWPKQYDLLSSLTTRAQSKRDFINITRQAYSKWGRAPLLSFTPNQVGLVQVDPNRKVWFISGCSQVLEKGQKVNQHAVVEAYWEKGDWFFSEVQNIGAGGPDDPCTVISGLPQLNGLVNDFASVLDKQTKDQLEKRLNDFKAQASVDFAIVTVNTTGSVPAFDYSLALARRWSVGMNNPSRDALLILIAIDDKRWHIQISHSLEEVLSNDQVAQMGSILNAPFREGRYGEGIKRCVDAFIKKLSELRGIPLNAAYRTPL